MYIGLGLGPEIAGGVLHFIPSSDVSTIFVINLASFILTLLFILFLLPESVPKERLKATAGGGIRIALRSGRVCSMAFAAAKDGLLKFFLPLSLFLPSRNPMTGTRNWNLTIFALGLIMYELSMVGRHCQTVTAI
jgi:hypothetical protein